MWTSAESLRPNSRKKAPLPAETRTVTQELNRYDRVIHLDSASPDIPKITIRYSKHQLRLITWNIAK